MLRAWQDAQVESHREPPTVRTDRRAAPPSCSGPLRHLLSSLGIHPCLPAPPRLPPLSPPSPSSPPIHSKFTPFSSIGTHDPLALSTCPQPSETDLACKATTDPYKLAGAMAQRIRGGDKVACTTKGPVPVLLAVKAIAIANTYLAEDGKQIKFTVSICDLENPEIHSDTVTSTYLHFALSAR